MLKKLIALMLLLCVALMTACGNNESVQGENEKDTTVDIGEPVQELSMSETELILNELENHRIITDKAVPQEKAEMPGGIMISVSVSYGEFHDSLEKMVECADLIISGTVVSSELVTVECEADAENLPDSIYTDSYIRVEEVFCGLVKTGDIVCVRQFGGTNGERTQYTPEKCPLMKVGNRYELYLDAAENTDEGYYSICGGYQGYLQINEDGSRQIMSLKNKIFNKENRK